jgi:hypothetical protein
MSAPEELDVRAAAKLAARTEETIRRWVWSGRLPARKRGNRLVVSRRDVEALTGRGRDLAPSLGEWAKLADAALRSHRGPHRSAADLVLEERQRRLEEVGHPGR